MLDTEAKVGLLIEHKRDEVAFDDVLGSFGTRKTNPSFTGGRRKDLDV